ncbi:hypothetical protein [Legionella antarctica]|nr:hypothetical protein [Legionella antarctica]
MMVWPLVFWYNKPMKKTNYITQKDSKTMEQMVADLQLKLVESEKKHQEHIQSKDIIISALHQQFP